MGERPPIDHERRLGAATDHVPDRRKEFAAGFALSASVVAFGLTIGLLWPNSAAINTWSGFLTLPLFGLAAAALFADPGAFATILNLLPFPQAAKLLADGLSPHAPYHAGLGSWAVIATWALLGYLILARIASRREI